MSTRNLFAWDQPWDIRGFDYVTPRPDVLVIRPNRDRKTAAFRELVFAVLFFLLWTVGTVFITWNLLKQGGPSLGPSSDKLFSALVFYGGLAAFAIGPLTVAGVLIYSNIQDSVIHHLTPITLDGEQDPLLLGDQVVCKLSDIRRMKLRVIEPTAASVKMGRPSMPRYGVSLRLASGRTIPRHLLLGQHLRYDLGYQAGDVATAVRSVAAFLGVEFVMQVEQDDTSEWPKGGSI